MSKWISVEDRLPEEGVSVIVWHRHWSVGMARRGMNEEFLPIGLINDKATHWMPLPAPPTDSKG